MRKITSLIVGLLASGMSLANPGEDGNVTITATNQVINAVSPISAAIMAGSNTLQVVDLSTLALPASSGVVDGRPLAAGDLLMIYQPQGGGIVTDSTDSVSYGSPSALGSVGRYEFVYVQSLVDTVSGPDTITIARPTGCSGFAYSYALGSSGVAAAQVIRVPQYLNLTVDSAGSIVGTAWNGSIGGVVIADVRGGANSNGTATINGLVNVSGQGFRGGVDDQRSTTTNGIVSYRTANASESAGKGESVIGGPLRYDALSGRYGRGAPANGGGGGNGHNGAGGGGANVGNGTWVDGRGVPDPGPAASWNDSWNLETPGIAGTSNPGGGRGGYSYGDSIQDENTVAPGNLVWGGDNRRQVGGLGGRPLSSDSGLRLYFGGGGGAGETNNATSGNGGIGGGLVLINARRVVGTGEIRANGSAGWDDADTDQINAATGLAGTGDTCCGDSPGGGGGGGTIALFTTTPSTGNSLTLRAQGGKGGDQLRSNATESEGGGGGGGGGLILAYPGATRSVTGGTWGISFRGSAAASPGNWLADFPPNGSTSGSPGLSFDPPPRNSAPFVCSQGPDATTPVSLAFVSSTARQNALELNFTTSAEIAHLGFVVETADGQRSPMLPAAAADSDVPRDYQTTLAPATPSFTLIDIDVTGHETRHGPYLAGQDYGVREPTQQIDWSRARTQSRSSQSQGQANAAQLQTHEAGMYRIEMSALQAAGWDATGIPADELALIGRSGPVARRVVGAPVLDASATIEFYSPGAAAQNAATEDFVLIRDRSRALPMPEVDARVLSGQPGQYRAEVRYAPKLGYVATSPTGSPWVAQSLRAIGNAAQSTLTLATSQPISSEGELTIAGFGGLDYPGAAPDHRLEVWLNDVQLAVHDFDGITPFELRLPVRNLSGTQQQLSLRAPGNTGYAADVIHVQSVHLRYTAATQADANQRFFGSDLAALPGTSGKKGNEASVKPEPARADGISLDGLSSRSLQIYAIDASGTQYLHVDSATIPTVLIKPNRQFWASASFDLLQPSVRAVEVRSLRVPRGTNYLAIGPSAFESAVAPLLAQHAADGLTPTFVDIEQLWLSRSAGNPDPLVLREFLAQQLPVDSYVLLVGADSFDAGNWLGSGSVSLVPSIYLRSSPLIGFAPSDEALGDRDGDGLSELKIGRLPARDSSEAAEVVRKILAYGSQPIAQRALLVSGPGDSTLDFTEKLPAYGNLLGERYVYQSIAADAMGMANARLALRDGLNQGQSLLAYIGHSGPTQWSFDPLLRASEIDSLEPNQNQPIVLQFACWTTYFVAARADTMAHRLMLSRERGASAVFGATVLQLQSSHDAMAAALLPRLQPGVRIGDAIRDAKRSMAKAAGPTEAIVATALLGDPAQRQR